MDDSVTSIAWKVLLATLTVVATRWLLGSQGTSLPKSRGNSSIYNITRKIQTIGILCAFFSVGLIVWFWNDLVTTRDRVLMAPTFGFLILGLWLALGSVHTDQNGIRKKFLFWSKAMRWDEITAVVIHKRDGGAIELRSPLRKLVIDRRFVAREHLVDEIVGRTHLSPKEMA
jgi:hypothetical protein